METANTKRTAMTPQPIDTTAAQASMAQPPSPPHSQADFNAGAKYSLDAVDASTLPFSPSSQTPVLQKEQEEFEGTVNVNNDLPSSEDLSRVDDLLVLDAQGQSRPFKELYKAPHIAPRQLIIFIRHFVNRTVKNICAPSRPRSSLKTSWHYQYQPQSSSLAAADQS